MPTSSRTMPAINRPSASNKPGGMKHPGPDAPAPTVVAHTLGPRATTPPPPASRPVGPALVASTSHIDSLTISPEDARDQALVLLARRGDQGALSQLLTAHQQRVYAICLRMTGDRDAAEDLAQETLYRVIKNLDQFNSRAKFTTWLTRVAMNVCLTAFRKNRLRRTVSLDAMGGDPSASTMGGTNAMFRSFGGVSLLGSLLSKLLGTSVGTKAGTTLGGTRTGAPNHALKYEGGRIVEADVPDKAALKENLARLYEALARLDPDQRAILILRDMQGLDYHHIAEILDIPPGTVKSRIFRARSALREIFEVIPASPD